MPRPIVNEITCKSALNHVQGMPFRWSLNPYRGCAHACHYCYARATHAYLGLGAGEAFSGVLMAKMNFAEVLRLELSARSWKRESVSLGTATDPYQPAPRGHVPALPGNAAGVVRLSYAGIPRQ